MTGVSSSIARADQQRRGDVAELERSDRCDDAPELATQDRANLEADRARCATFGSFAARIAYTIAATASKPGMTDAGSRWHADEGDERDAEQRSDDRAEVVHRALEAVRPPYAPAGTTSREQRVAGGDASPRTAHAAERSTATCQTAFASPISDDSTAVVP